MTRRLFLRSAGYVAGAGVPVASYARWVEPVNLHVAQIECALPGLRAERPVRLVHLSDLHASPHVPKSLIESAVELTIDLRPDLVCITGDWVTYHSGWSAAWYRQTLRRLSAHVPCFGSMGNHDGGWRRSGMKDTSVVRSLVKDSGFHVLHNNHTRVQAAGAELELVGLADWWSGEFRPEVAFPSEPQSAPRILLSHNPDTKDKAGRQPWDLMLSGHTHGGQVVVPVFGSPWAPVRDKRYLHGLKPWQDRQIHVTSGVGNAGGVRLNCPPEIVLMELVADAHPAALPAATKYLT